MKFLSACLLFIVITLNVNAQLKNVDLIITNVNIVDVVNNKIIPHRYIAIQKNKIIDISNVSISKTYTANEIIDATGKYIMPSLWDMHVHFGGDSLKAENKMLLPLYIAMGIGHVRDCAGDISLDVIEWKNEIANGTLLGPSIFTSGPKLEGINSIWPGDLEISNETELRTALDSLYKLKVDFVKITDNTLAPDLFLKSIIT